MSRFFLASLLVVTLALAGCTEDDAGPLSKPRTASASPGDAVLRVPHTEVMPNAFGGKDVFGRTRDTGTTTVFLASAGNGKAVFRRQDVEIISAKSTLNSSPTVITTGKKASDVIVLPAFTPKDQIGQMRETTFTLTAAPGHNAVTIDGHTLTVLAVQGNLVTYSAN